MNSEQLKIFNNTDWGLILNELANYCDWKVRKLIWTSPEGSLSKGLSSDDIVTEAIKKTLEGIKEDGKGRKWNQEVNATLLEHLKDVVDSDVSNLVMSLEHRSTDYADEDRDKIFETVTEGEDDSSGEVFRFMTSQCREQLKEDFDAIKVLDAFFDLHELDVDHPRPRDIAEYSGLDIKVVNNVLKKIRRTGEKIKGIRNEY